MVLRDLQILLKSNYAIFSIIIFEALLGLITYTIFGRQPFFFIALLSLPYFLLKLNRSQIYLPSYLVAFLLFVLFEIFSKYFYFGMTPFVGEPYFIRTLQYAISFILIFLIINSTFHFNYILTLRRVYTIFLIFAAFISLMELVSPNLVPHPSDVELFYSYERLLRVYGIFNWSSDKKELLLSIPIILLLLTAKKERNKKDLFQLILPSFILILLSGSRAALLNFIIVLLINYRKNISLSLSFAIILSIGLGFLILSYVNYDFNYFVNERLQADTESRTLIYNYAISKLSGSWLMGNGLGGVKGVDQLLIEGIGNRVHNGFLALLINHGLIGLFLYVRFLYLLLKHLYKFGRINNDYAPLFAILIFCLTNLTTDMTHLVYSGLVFCFIYDQSNKNRFKNNQTI